MRKINLILLLLSASLFSYSGGDGSLEAPFEIGSSDDLVQLAETPGHWGKSFKFTSDVDMKGLQIDPIAPEQEEPFGGTVQGGSHKIHNLSYTGRYSETAGLFANLSQNARIADLHLVKPKMFAARDDLVYAGSLAGLCKGKLINCSASEVKINVRCGDYAAAGSLVGRLKGGQVTGCSSSGEINVYAGRRAFAGGLIGYSLQSVVENSSSVCDVSVDSEKFSYAGGITGYAVEGEITRCFTKACRVSSGNKNSYCGGISGELYNGTLTACWSKANVFPQKNAFGGGIAGRQYYSIIRNSFFAGGLSTELSDNSRGGVAGETQKSILEGCFWDIETSECFNPAGCGDEYKGRTSRALKPELMKDYYFYKQAGWLFAGQTKRGEEPNWKEVHGSLPQLYIKGTSETPLDK
ncbi:GLUG domain protein [Sedimentisphaera cyanobacteriorum]|uniref:GLUG domain protein n=1 Tax=Sedimentisphaera cyanobacteriorum TaxID=1940790 RepID=A0A1Q2HN63_9BACT|nr:hypothetical protein [Sedimentisphaera cyanobacteriorum]AQQ08888.1 GLUG domain protein [Sedimentisphaera cyanobacteriorum]